MCPARARPPTGASWSSCRPTRTRSAPARRRWRRAPRRRARRAIPIPTATALREALGALHGIDPARIVCGTGSDELLNLAAQAFAGPGDEVIYVRYGFSVYDIAARRCGATAGGGARRRLRHRRRRAARLRRPSGRGWCSSPTRTTRPAATCRAPSSRGSTPACRGDVLLVLDQAYAEYLAPEDDDGGLALAARARQRARHAHLLEDLRPRRRAGRLGDRRARADRRAQPHPRAVQRDRQRRRPRRSRRSPTRPSSTRSREHNRAERDALRRSASRRSATTACARCRARPTSCWCCSRAR